MNARHVLLVEDSPEDADLAARSWSRLATGRELRIADDGDAAWRMLSAESAPPCLVLLDLNLPAIDGREVLRRLKQHPDLHSLPVVVLTTSTHPADVDDCCRLGASGYFRKPSNVSEFDALLRLIWEYWSRSDAPAFQTLARSRR